MTELEQLKKENAELKDRVDRAERVEKIFNDAPEVYRCFDTAQSLAEHDKQVKVEAIEGLISHLNNSEFKSVQRAYLDGYLNQLKQDK